MNVSASCALEYGGTTDFTVSLSGAVDWVLQLSLIKQGCRLFPLAGKYCCLKSVVWQCCVLGSEAGGSIWSYCLAICGEDSQRHFLHRCTWM